MSKIELSDRRVKVVPISFSMLIEMITAGWSVGADEEVKLVECLEGIPADAECVGSSVDDFRQIAYLHFFHPSFDPVGPQEKPPEILVNFRRHYREPYPAATVAWNKAVRACAEITRRAHDDAPGPQEDAAAVAATQMEALLKPPARRPDGERYRVCIRCDIPHIENCLTCLGFGLNVDGRTPVSASDASHTSEFLMCPECGSTPAGIPVCTSAPTPWLSWDRMRRELLDRMSGDIKADSALPDDLLLRQFWDEMDGWGDSKANL